jgi:hypothetical protein
VLYSDSWSMDSAGRKLRRGSMFARKHAGRRLRPTSAWPCYTRNAKAALHSKRGRLSAYLELCACACLL